MITWVLIFVVAAILVGVFGFGGISLSSTGIGKIMIFFFLVIFLVALLIHAVGS